MSKLAKTNEAALAAMAGDGDDDHAIVDPKAFAITAEQEAWLTKKFFGDGQYDSTRMEGLALASATAAMQAVIDMGELCLLKKQKEGMPAVLSWAANRRLGQSSVYAYMRVAKLAGFKNERIAAQIAMEPLRKVLALTSRFDQKVIEQAAAKGHLSDVLKTFTAEELLRKYHGIRGALKAAQKQNTDLKTELQKVKDGTAGPQLSVVSLESVIRHAVIALRNVRIQIQDRALPVEALVAQALSIRRVLNGAVQDALNALLQREKAVAAELASEPPNLLAAQSGEKGEGKNAIGS